MSQSRLSLTKEEYQHIVGFIAKKFAFNEMFLKESPCMKDREQIKGELMEADLLLQRLAQHPDYITENTARWIIAFLIDTQEHYEKSIKLVSGLGYRNTEELKKQLAIAQALHDKLNEFLIDCIQD